ncbi:hypothetical protein ABPG72_003837, partial [Tetrahymena utriculariae]
MGKSPLKKIASNFQIRFFTKKIIGTLSRGYKAVFIFSFNSQEAKIVSISIERQFNCYKNKKRNSIIRVSLIKRIAFINNQYQLNKIQKIMNNSNLRHSTLSVAALPKQGEIRTTQLFEYTNGIFQGQMSGYPLKKNGLGVFAFDNGDFYFGEWENDQLQGEGILFFAFGGFVHGYFEKSKLQGPAFLKFSNGEIYEGYWNNGIIDGEAYNYFIDENLWLKCLYSNGKFQNLLEEGEGRAPS